MSRFRRVVHNIVAVYGVLVTSAICGLAAIPIAFHYLSPERFGLWALMSTIAGYLALADFGMANSVGRLLVDYKDLRHTPSYGSMVKTSYLVIAVQGCIVATAGLLIAPWLPAIFNVSEGLGPEFVALARWQSISIGLSFWNIFFHILIAHQRLDITNGAQMFSLILNLGLVWFFFALGAGILALAWASIIMHVLQILAGLAACLSLRLLPTTGLWGRLSLPEFRRIFNYGRDIFLISIGSQLILASQAMIITRQLGLTAAAAWAVATRAFFILCQAVWRIFDMSAPAFSEMISRGEKPILEQRFQHVFTVGASLAGVIAVSFAAINSDFVHVLTHKRIEWPAMNNVLLGIWLLVGTRIHAMNGLTILTKDIRAMRYVYLLEGAVFVSLAFFLAPFGGIPVIIFLSILCGLLFSGSYGYARLISFFRIQASTPVLWMKPMFKALAFLIPVNFGLFWISRVLLPGPVRLTVLIALCSLPAAFALLRIGLPMELRRELLARSNPRVASLLKPLFGCGKESCA